jgi:hypothetical protein
MYENKSANANGRPCFRCDTIRKTKKPVLITVKAIATDVSPWLEFSARYWGDGGGALDIDILLCW